MRIDDLDNIISELKSFLKENNFSRHHDYINQVITWKNKDYNFFYKINNINYDNTHNTIYYGYLNKKNFFF